MLFRRRVTYVWLTGVGVMVLAAVATGFWLRSTGPLRLVGADDPVSDAARGNQLTAVQELLARGTDVNTPGRDGTPALLWAVYHENAEMVDALLEAGAAVDAANLYGVTPLLQASRTGSSAIVSALLSAGADANRAHPDGQTPLMAAARAGDLASVRQLLAHNADVNATDTYQQTTALMWAASDGHAEVVDALLRAGADPNRQARVTTLTQRANADYPTGGFTAVMWAARNGYRDVIDRLVAGGANLDLTNGDGVTAMTLAIVNDRFDIAAALLDLGANANDGSLYFAIEMRDATTDWYALDGSQLRANHPNTLTALDLVKRLLEHGADPNRWAHGQVHSLTMCCGVFANASPFYRAAEAADVASLELMLAHGADVERAPARVEWDGRGDGESDPNTNVGRTPLLVAMNGGRGVPLSAGPGFREREGPPPFREPSNRRPVDAMKVLLDAGANPDAAGPDGSTALHHAARQLDADIVRLLLKAGAATGARDKAGLTPLEAAEARYAKELAGDARAGRRLSAVKTLLQTPVAQQARRLTPKPPAARGSER